MDKTKFKVIEGDKDHGTSKCDCPFCRCHCPVCGNIEIEVTFRPEWNLRKKDKVILDRMGDFIRLECPECGEFEDGDIFQPNEDLSPLKQLFQEVLGLPTMVILEYEEDGTISIQRGYPPGSIEID